MDELLNLTARAREISYNFFGKKITFYIPGMFCYNGEFGDYPAISLTGAYCKLNCPHCGGKLLKSMIHINSPDELIKACEGLKKRNAIGCLLTGGFDQHLCLPWKEFVPAIKEIKEKTDLKISIHCGILDLSIASMLKEAGIDQALIDVIGDDKTLSNIYHADINVIEIFRTIEILNKVGIPVIPHIVIGLNYGRIVGEYQALEIIKQYDIHALVFVSLMPLPGTAMESIETPAPTEIARIMAQARLNHPRTIMSLGCARKRGDYNIDLWAVECGINRIALPSEEAIAKAKEYRLEIEWKKTCCSI